MMEEDYWKHVDITEKIVNLKKEQRELQYRLEMADCGYKFCYNCGGIMTEQDIGWKCSFCGLEEKPDSYY